MKHPDAPPLPAWIMKKDGRIMPFNEDQICKDLYEAGVKLGKPDPFLARELADATSYFLASENPGATLKQEDIIYAVTRTVREFGHPDIALKYPELAYQGEFIQDFDDVATELFPGKNFKTHQEYNRDKMLKAVMPPDISAGIEEAWIQMEGLSFPDGLLSSTWAKEDWFEMVLQRPLEFILKIKNLAAKHIHFEGAEYLALEHDLANPEIFKNALAVMDACLTKVECHGVLHLNFPIPPLWFTGLNYSPLFVSKSEAEYQKRLKITRSFLDAWIDVKPKKIKMHWHQLGPIDEKLSSLFNDLSQNQNNWAFSQLSKSEAIDSSVKMDRNVLDKVHLRLDKLVRVCARKGILDRFETRLPSLVRLGVSAGVQKRSFLRKIEMERRQFENLNVNLAAGFLLEKARLIIAPKGIPDLLESIFPGKSYEDEEVLGYVRNILNVLKETVNSEEKKGFIPISIDLSHLLEVKESKIKALVDLQRGGPKFILPIDLQGKLKWVKSIVSEWESCSIFVFKEKVMFEDSRKLLGRIDSLEW